MLTPGDARVKRFPVTEEGRRLGWLTVLYHPFNPEKLPVIRLGVEPPLRDPAHPQDVA